MGIHMFDLKPGATEPQGLLIATFMICHTMLTFSMEMGTLAPQYTAFGGQKYCPSPAQAGVVANKTKGLLLLEQQGVSGLSSSPKTDLFASSSSSAGSSYRATDMLLVANASANSSNSSNTTCAYPMEYCGWTVSFELSKEDPPRCKLTVLSQLMSSIQLRYSFFAYLFFYTSFLFVALFLLWFSCEVFCPMCRPESEDDKKRLYDEDDKQEGGGCAVM